MSKLYRICIFLGLFTLCNLFLWRPGLWLYSDASYWYKNLNEVLTVFFTQFSSYITLSYYPGYDLNIFTYARVVSIVINLFLFIFLGSTLSQIVYIGSAYILSFLSFNLFSNIFIKQKITVFILSLIFVFNPLFFNLLNEGYIYVYAGIPLFVYSLHMYLRSKKTNTFFLLINIISLFLIISYLRFISIALIVIIPYCIVLLACEKYNISRSRILIAIASYLLVTAPILLNAFFAFFVDKSNGASNFISTYGSSVLPIKFPEGVNLFQSINIPLYNDARYLNASYVLLLLYFFIIAWNIREAWRKSKLFIVISFILLIFGLFLYCLGNISSGNIIFNRFIAVLGFLQNNPYYALYIISIPSILLLGVISKQSKYLFFVFSALFLVISISPFVLKLNEVSFKKLVIKEIPSDYDHYFISPVLKVPEATYYVPFYCWDGKYLGDIPTPCYNYMLSYPQIQQNNARLLSGESYLLSKSLVSLENFNVNNLRITHNLKDIFIADDIIPSSQTPVEKDKVAQARISLDANTLLHKQKENHFTLYEYENKDDYDFLLYLPQKTISKPVSSIFDNSLDPKERPVIINRFSSFQSQSNSRLVYKYSVTNPTQYFLKIEQVRSMEPIVVQLDQTYSRDWKLKLVDSSYFENQKCINVLHYFPISGNTQCILNGNIFSTNSLSLLFHTSLNETQHTDGNYIDNTWVINPSKNDIKSGIIYAVIVYEKQLYLFYAIIISLATTLVLIIISSVYLCKYFLIKRT